MKRIWWVGWRLGGVGFVMEMDRGLRVEERVKTEHWVPSPLSPPLNLKEMVQIWNMEHLQWRKRG